MRFKFIIAPFFARHETSNCVECPINSWRTSELGWFCKQNKAKYAHVHQRWRCTLFNRNVGSFISVVCQINVNFKITGWAENLNRVMQWKCIADTEIWTGQWKFQQGGKLVICFSPGGPPCWKRLWRALNFKIILKTEACIVLNEVRLFLYNLASWEGRLVCWFAGALAAYLELVYLVTALVPSLTACFASSPGRRSRTAVWISRLVMVDLLL